MSLAHVLGFWRLDWDKLADVNILAMKTNFVGYFQKSFTLYLSVTFIWAYFSSIHFKKLDCIHVLKIISCYRRRIQFNLEGPMRICSMNILCIYQCLFCLPSPWNMEF